jgi:hypothetical protein
MAPPRSRANRRSASASLSRFRCAPSSRPPRPSRCPSARWLLLPHHDSGGPPTLDSLVSAPLGPDGWNVINGGLIAARQASDETIRPVSVDVDAEGCSDTLTGSGRPLCRAQPRGLVLRTAPTMWEQPRLPSVVGRCRDPLGTKRFIAPLPKGAGHAGVLHVGYCDRDFTVGCRGRHHDPAARGAPCRPRDR